MDCPICNHQFNLPIYQCKKGRRINLSIGCPDCHAVIQYLSIPNVGQELVGANYRFKHSGTTWNLWYQARKSFSRYVAIKHEKRVPTETPIPRQEHQFAGYVSPDRFKNLVAFL